ncbi:MAG: O-antigen ligase family protein, partial [Oscillospiraceae bacterium]|nr:O-antigen ligase family protein [Oscillospiraceae bacterium]
ALILHINVPAMLFFVAVCIFFLVFSDDLLSITLPLMMIFLLASTYFKDLTFLLAYFPYAVPPFALAVIFQLVYYRRPFVKGRMLYPLVAVSAALIIGGAGVIPLDEYLLPLNFYYILGLGAFMIFIYCLCMSRLRNERGYDRTERLACILYVSGIAAVLTVLVFCADNLGIILEKGRLIFYKPRNFISSVLLMCMPSALPFIRKNSLHLFGLAAMYAGMLLTGSRSGLLFGTVLLCLCLAYEYFTDTEKRSLYNRLFAVLSIPIVILALILVPKLYSGRLIDGSLISSDETRVKFIKLGIEDFLAHPILGIGLSNQKNIGIFPGIFPGCLVFYHNILIQIPASLGITGVAAFLWQFSERIKLILKTRKTKLFIFTLSYIGILMMSLTNPGILCPFPETALLVLIFAVMEHSLEENDNNL